MAFELVKGDITIRTDSEHEAERVYRWLDTGMPAPSTSEVLTVDEVLTELDDAERSTLPTLPADVVKSMQSIPTSLQSIPTFITGPPPEESTPAKLVALNPPESQMIPVRKLLLEVLEVLLEFPEGISSRGIETLTGITQSKVGHRLTKLKKQDLAEQVSGSVNWRATQLARRAKLIGS